MACKNCKIVHAAVGGAFKLILQVGRSWNANSNCVWRSLPKARTYDAA